ncbi:hypothetical protein CTI12_AA060020 [Artemisia annua]|uniref:BED-type domain-containing protein n=1 Tax=Artemisia annua TaxID=35608 RepID=A0A2U1Q8K8_ARTAN|nr:hypothetical protein CTI12_AA060020 [Artemisia annua]
MSTSNTTTNNTEAGSTSAPTIVKTLTCERVKDPWEHYNLVQMSDGKKKAQCKYCLSIMSANSNSTLRAHIKQKYCKALKNTPEAGQSSMARDRSIFAYNHEAVRQQFAGLMIKRGLPFNHWDDEDTTEVMQTYVQPMYNQVSRMTLKRDAMNMWKKAKQELQNFLLNLDTCVNITTDVWSAPHGSPYSYLCVTAHWVSPESWLIMKRVISFEEFPVPHTGNALFKMLRKVFYKYNLQKKVFSITLDNASNNINAMGRMKMEFEPPLNGIFYHSRCVAHIINLTVHAGLADSITSQMKDCFKQMLSDTFKKGLWEYYFEKYGNPTPADHATSSSSRSSHRRNLIHGLLQKLRENPNKRAKSDRLQNNEYTRYTGTDFISSSLEDALEIEGGVYEVEVQEGTIELLSDEEIRQDEAATASRSVDDDSEEENYE